MLHNMRHFMLYNMCHVMLYNMKYVMFYTMMWMLRAMWLVVAHDLLEYRYMDDVKGNLFSLFCSTWHAVLKMFVRLFRVEVSESFGKRLAGAIYKEEKWKNGDQKSYWLLDNA